jgi:excisionase family DNA binding protein
VRLAERLYLTIGEASEYTGLGIGYLRRQIAEQRLKLVKGAGPHRADVLRRVDLEKL